MEEGRWRTATIVVTTVAALEFVALAGAGVALLGNPLASHLKAEVAAAASPRLHATPRPRPSQARLPRSETSVMVLNGGGRAGAAAAEAGLVSSRGYLVGNVGNASRADYTHTLVMYRPGYGAEGARLASDLHVRIISPLDGMRPRELAGAHLVVILGR
jgi:LytR cell envelope-related transcriptional attenuator